MAITRENLCSLVYKLCEQRELPVLVTDHVAEYLDKRDLLRISIISRDLNVHANASIYRDIVIDLNGSERSIRSASLLLRTLLANDTAAHAVRALSLIGEPLVGWRNEFSRGESAERPLRDNNPPEILGDITNFTRQEIESYAKAAALPSAHVHEVPVWALCLHILRLASGTRRLSVSSDYFRFPAFREAFQDLANRGFLQKLEHCNLCLDLLQQHRRHPKVVQEWDSALLVPFKAPDLTCIAVIASLASAVARQLHWSGRSITRLTLHHYQTSNSDLRALLASTPKLQYLEYHAMTDCTWLKSGRRRAVAETGNGVGLDPLYDALHHVRDSLQVLHTSHDFHWDSYHFEQSDVIGYEPPFRRSKELSSLQRLHTLTIPYMTLLGWTTRDCDWADEWSEILPSSLRHVTFTDNLYENTLSDDIWTDDSLVPVILSLVEWMSSAQQGRSNVPEFRLHLFQLDESPFN